MKVLKTSFKALCQYFPWKEWGELTKIPVRTAAHQATIQTQNFCLQSKCANYSNNILQKIHETFSSKGGMKPCLQVHISTGNWETEK